jgi:transcription factor 1
MMQYMNACLDQTLFHRYGLVRVIALLPSEHAEVILPKAVSKRRKVALLAEAVSAEVTEVAGDTSKSRWVSLKGMSTFERSASRVISRATEKGMVVPESRKVVPLELAPKAVRQRGNDGAVGYMRRPKLDWHNEYVELETAFKENLIQNPPQGTSAEEISRQPSFARYKRMVLLRRRLLQENREAAILQDLNLKQADIDSLKAVLPKLLADPHANVDEVNTLINKIDNLESVRDRLLNHLAVWSKSIFERNVDERRCFDDDRSGKVQQPLLFWDRRTYEPLHIAPEEIYPRLSCSVLDFRPNPDSAMMVKQRKHMEMKTPNIYFSTLEAFRHLIGLFALHNSRPVTEILDRIFPGRPIPELIEAIPSLSRFATPKIHVPTHAPRTEAESGPTPPPDTEAHQRGHQRATAPESISLKHDDNSLSGVNLRTIPATVVWDMAVEWEKWPFKPQTEWETFKVLGGSSRRNAAFKYNI